METTDNGRHNLKYGLKPVKIRIERLHCYHCARTFLTQDAFEYHVHDGEICPSSSSSSSSNSSSSSSSEDEESDEHDSDDNSLIFSDSSSSSESISQPNGDNNDNNNSTNTNTDKNKKRKKKKKLNSGKKSLKKIKFPFPCTYESCKSKFTRYVLRKNHLIKVHGEVFPPPTAEEEEALRSYVCPVETCSKRFISASSLSAHKLSHREATIPCPHDGCNRLFTLPYVLRRHLKESHTPKYTNSNNNNNGDDGTSTSPHPGFECTICSKTLKSKRNYKMHMKFVHDPVISVRYKCDICPNRGFPTKSYLQDHVVRMHEGRKRDSGKTDFPCSHCERVFNHRSTRNQHVKVTHLGIKKFLCHLCPFRCTNKPRLEEHVRAVHDKIYEHLCSICGKYLSSIANLQRHVKAHSGSKPCKCPFEGCTAAYTQNPSLKIHIQKYHQGQDPNTNTNTNEYQNEGRIKINPNLQYPPFQCM